MLKLAITNLLALIFWNYNKRAIDIIFAVDASVKQWRGVFILLIKEKNHLLRYESKIFFSVKKKYNATKQEY